MGDAKKKREAAAKGIKVKLPKGRGPKLFQDTCTYCLKKTGCNWDHVFSDNLFPSIVHKTALIQVPSCVKCNNDLSKLESFFRVVMVMGSPQKNEPETKSVFDAAKRSIDKVPKIKAALKRGWKTVLTTDPVTGVKRPSITYFPDKPALADLAPVFWKISAGLYRHRKQQLLDGVSEVTLILRDQHDMDPNPPIQAMRNLIATCERDPPGGWQDIDINGKRVVRWIFCPLKKQGMDYQTQGVYAFEFHQSNVYWFVVIGSDAAALAGELGH